MKISKIIAEEISDSRENPTVKVTVFAGDISDSFSVPSGASTGLHEARELRDDDGRGVKKAIEKVNKIIAPMLLGQDISNQREIDRIMIELDGTPDKNNLGGNAMTGVSLACAKTAAKVNNQEVYQYLSTLAEIRPSREKPYLFMNLINGGKHARNDLAFQEYHIVPDTADPAVAVDIGLKIQNTLKKLITRDLGEESVILGDEGGLAPKISDNRKPLLYLNEAIKENNLQSKVHLALDVAASSFYENGVYKIAGENIASEKLAILYQSLVDEFNLFSIEDPFNEEDFESFTRLCSSSFGGAKKILVVGDDLTVSNQILLKKAIEKRSINAMIIKPNQIGTLSETLETMRLARENNLELIISHRSGETDDDFIADLAYAFGCFGLKAGSPVKFERMIKYQRLIDISK